MLEHQEVGVDADEFFICRFLEFDSLFSVSFADNLDERLIRVSCEDVSVASCSLHLF